MRAPVPIPPVAAAGDNQANPPPQPPQRAVTLEELTRRPLNTKALHVLYCALSPSGFNHVSSCTTAKETRDTLQGTFEGTDQIRDKEDHPS